MKSILALDLSTKTGWAFFNAVGKLEDYGQVVVEVEDFNVNNYPNLSKKYPYNIVSASNEMAEHILNLVECFEPEVVVIENTVRGRNRHTQRILEWVHKAVLDYLEEYCSKIMYLDPSDWRRILNMRLTKEDKKHNREVSQGKKRGRLTRKHLSVRMVNEQYNLELKLVDNDIADAIALGTAAIRVL